MLVIGNLNAIKYNAVWKDTIYWPFERDHVDRSPSFLNQREIEFQKGFVGSMDGPILRVRYAFVPTITLCGVGVGWVLTREKPAPVSMCSSSSRE